MKQDRTYLNLFKWNFKRERLVVVRVEGALLDARLFLLESLAVLDEADLHVRVWKARFHSVWK